MRSTLSYAPFVLPFFVGDKGRSTLILVLSSLLVLSSDGWDPWKFLALSAISFIATLAIRAGYLSIDYYWLFNKIVSSVDLTEHFDGARIVRYSRDGKEYKAYLPFDIKAILPMSETTVYLLKGDRKIDITQEPGVLYMFSAEDLGGDGFLLNTPDGERVVMESKVPLRNIEELS